MNVKYIAIAIAMSLLLTGQFGFATPLFRYKCSGTLVDNLSNQHVTLNSNAQYIERGFPIDSNPKQTVTLMALTDNLEMVWDNDFVPGQELHVVPRGFDIEHETPWANDVFGENAGDYYGEDGHPDQTMIFDASNDVVSTVVVCRLQK